MPRTGPATPPRVPIPTSEPRRDPPLLAAENDEYRVLSRAVRDHFDDRPGPVRILEAGCGREWPLDLGAHRAVITGVDLNAESLRLRRDLHHDLDEAIVGDLFTVDLPVGQFDVVYSSYVLEHVPHPRRLLDRFASWVAPGGLIILRIPDRDSVWGFAARHAPYQVQVWFRRYAMGMANAGKPGFGPFPVVYDPAIARPAIHRFCDTNGLEVLAEYGTNHYVARLGRWRPAVTTVTRMVAACSGGRLTADRNNLAFVIGKPPTPAVGD